MSAIENGRPVYFIRERRITEGYEKVKENTPYHSYNTIKKIRVVNDNDNDRIIP